MSSTDIHLLQLKLQRHLQKRGLSMQNAGTSEIIPKEKKSTILTLHSPFCIFLIKIP